MNFIESTNFFLRTIMFDFINRDEDIKLKFRLAPMIHIGSKEYYKTVFDLIKDCDEIFVEGIKYDSKASSAFRFNLTFNQYEIIAKKLGLVTQKELRLKDLKDKLTHIDYDTVTIEKAWKELSWREKMKLSIVDPFELFIYTQGITREIMAKSFMTAAEESHLAFGDREDEEGTARNFIMNNREQIIFKNIKDRIEKEASQDKTIAIIYGAGHMKSIARYIIDNYNYLPRNGQFMKVFDID